MKRYTGKSLEADVQPSGCFAKPTPPNCAFFKHSEITDDSTGKTHECFFYEDKGKDPNEAHGKRWRVCFYYASHMALTKFFASEIGKDRFLASLQTEARK